MLKQVSPAAALPLHVEAVKKHLIIDHNEDDDLLISYISAAVQWVEDFTNRALVQQGWVNLQNCFGQSIQLNRLPVIAVDSIQYIDENDTQPTVPAANYRVGSESGKITLRSGKTWPNQLLIEEGISTNFQVGHLIPVNLDFATNIFSVKGIGVADDEVIFLYSNHTMPSGLGASTAYTVVNSSGSEFQLSLTSGGSTINITDVGIGDLFIGELSQAVNHALLLLIGHWYNNRENVITGTIVAEIPMGVESLLNPYKAYL